MKQVPRLSKKTAKQRGPIDIESLVASIKWDELLVPDEEAGDQIPKARVKPSNARLRDGDIGDPQRPFEVKGGPGSGNFAHAGRPGIRGGSASAAGRSGIQGGSVSVTAGSVSMMKEPGVQTAFYTDPALMGRAAVAKPVSKSPELNWMIERSSPQTWHTGTAGGQLPYSGKSRAFLRYAVVDKIQKYVKRRRPTVEHTQTTVSYSWEESTQLSKKIAAAVGHPVKTKFRVTFGNTQETKRSTTLTYRHDYDYETKPGDIINTGAAYMPYTPPAGDVQMVLFARVQKALLDLGMRTDKGSGTSGNWGHTGYPGRGGSSGGSAFARIGAKPGMSRADVIARRTQAGGGYKRPGGESSWEVSKQLSRAKYAAMLHRLEVTKIRKEEEYNKHKNDINVLATANAGQLPEGEDTTSDRFDLYLQTLPGTKGTMSPWTEASEGTRAEYKQYVQERLTYNLSLQGIDAGDANVQRFIKQWAHTSNDETEYSLSIQADAAEVFGVELSDWQKAKIAKTMGSMGPDEMDSILGTYVNYESGRVAQKAAIAAIYNETQAQLDAAGFEPGDTIRLRRGIALPKEALRGAVPGDPIMLEGSALESWTTGTRTAWGFSALQVWDVKNGIGLVVEMDVPRSAIFSTPQSGFGCLTEGEVVIIGSVPGNSARIVGWTPTDDMGLRPDNQEWEWAKGYDPKVSLAERSAGLYDRGDIFDISNPLNVYQGYSQGAGKSLALDQALSIVKKMLEKGSGTSGNWGHTGYPGRGGSSGGSAFARIGAKPGMSRQDVIARRTLTRGATPGKLNYPKLSQAYAKLTPEDIASMATDKPTIPMIRYMAPMKLDQAKYAAMQKAIQFKKERRAAGLESEYSDLQKLAKANFGRPPEGPDRTHEMDRWLFTDVQGKEHTAWGLKQDVMGAWESATDTSRALYKIHVARQIAQDLNAQGMDVDGDQVKSFIQQWAQTSNDDNERSLSIQADAAEVFGVELSDWQKGKINNNMAGEGLEFTDYDIMRSAFTGDDSLRNKQKAALISMYNTTQSQLEAAGLGPSDTVRLRRGVGVPRTVLGDAAPGDYVQVEGSALESWSLGTHTAFSFGRRAGRRGGLEMRGLVLEMDVPRSAIVATPKSGFGCLGEGEFIVLGSVPGNTARIVGWRGDTTTEVNPTGWKWAPAYNPRVSLGEGNSYGGTVGVSKYPEFWPEEDQSFVYIEPYKETALLRAQKALLDLMETTKND